MRRIFSNLVRWLKSFFVSQSAPAGHETPPPDWDNIRRSQPPPHWLDLAKSSGPLLQFSREPSAQGAAPQTQRDVKRSAPTSTSDKTPRLVVPASNGSTQSRRPETAAKVSVSEDRDGHHKKRTRIREALSRLLKPALFAGRDKDNAGTNTVTTQTPHFSDASKRAPAQLAEWTKNGAERSAGPLEFDEAHGSQPEPANFSHGHSLGDEPKSIRLRVPDSARPHQRKAEYAVGLSSPLSQRPVIASENRWPRLKQENLKSDRLSFSGSEVVDAVPEKTFTEAILAMVADLWPELPDDSDVHEPHPRSAIRTAQRAQQLKLEQRGF